VVCGKEEMRKGKEVEKEKMRTREMLRDRRIRLLLFCVVLSIALISVKGISTGLDLKGGSLIQVKAEKPLTKDEMDQVTRILDQRLRGGIKVRDVKIRPWGDQYLLIYIAGVDIIEAQKLIGKPGVLTVKVGNITVFTGADLSKVESSKYDPRRGTWGVPFTISDKAAENLRDAEVETNFTKIDMYLDEGTGVIVTNSSEFISKFDLSPSKGLMFQIGPMRKLTLTEAFIDGYLKTITNVQKIPVNGLQGNMIKITYGGQVGEYVTFSEQLEEMNVSRIEDLLKKRGLFVLTGRSGLVNSAPPSYSLQEEFAAGKVIKGLILETGSGDQGKEEARRMKVILRSGALPIKVDIVGSWNISPTLGEEFAKNSIIAGLLAFLGVSLIVFFRYRKLKLAIPILITGTSEIIIILGVASLINWDIDLPAIAGIIAAIGTGVDNQIVILDEYLLEKEKSAKYRIKQAFFIVMGSYFTLIAAMVPLFIVGFGMLQGFAVTTIIGATVGVYITRPAYARVIEYMKP